MKHILASMRRLWHWLTRRRQLQASVVAIAPAEPPPSPLLLAAPDVVAQKPAKRQRKQTARLKADVLEELDRYQVYIKRLKKWHPEAYAMYRRLGAFICHPDSEGHTDRLEPEILETLPGFGAIALCLADEKGADRIGVKFAFFLKLKQPGVDVERVNYGITYRLHVYWDDARDKELAKFRDCGIGNDFLVNIGQDGTLRALRVLRSETQVLRHRQADTIGNLTSRGKVTTVRAHTAPASYVTKQRWGLPEATWNDPSITNPADRIRRLFCLVVNFWHAQARRSMIRVTATKRSVVMPFVVDVQDTPAFFADREPVVGPDGKTKRIFHVVRPHVRQTARGQRGVRLHFAGLRRFTWNGYAIAITVPGRDHLDLADWSIEALEDLPPEEHGPELIDFADAVDWLADKIGAPGKTDEAA